MHTHTHTCMIMHAHIHHCKQWYSATRLHVSHNIFSTTTQNPETKKNNNFLFIKKHTMQLILYYITFHFKLIYLISLPSYSYIYTFLLLILYEHAVIDCYHCMGWTCVEMCMHVCKCTCVYVLVLCVCAVCVLCVCVCALCVNVPCVCTLCMCAFCFFCVYVVLYFSVSDCDLLLLWVNGNTKANS